MIVCKKTALKLLSNGSVTKAELRAAKIFESETVEDLQAAEQASELYVFDSMKLSLEQCMYLLDRIKAENDNAKRN